MIYLSLINLKYFKVSKSYFLVHFFDQLFAISPHPFSLHLLTHQPKFFKSLVQTIYTTQK